MPDGRVLVLGDNGALAERRIQAGLANWEYTEVTSGLDPGERVVTSLERAGVKGGVRATPEEKAGAAPGK